MAQPARDELTLAQIIARAQLAQTNDTPMTLADIAALLPAGMTAVSDDRGYIADTSSLAVKCSRSHIHKYYQRDIARGSIACVTCNWGTQFIKMVREIAEDILGVPFVVRANDDFVNVPLGITITCYRVRGVNMCSDNSNNVHMHLYLTESRRKIINALHEYLQAYPRINEQQLAALRDAVASFAPKPKKGVFIPKPLLRRQVFMRNIVPDVSPTLYLEDFIISGM